MSEAPSSWLGQWRSVGERPVTIVRRKASSTLHALRSGPRGYGKRRREWQRTTECGQMADGNYWAWRSVALENTTCLSCRSVVRQILERSIEDLGMDEYDRLHVDDWWRIQAEWHKPDEPLLMKGDRVSHAEYGAGLVIVSANVESGEITLVTFDARPLAPKSVPAVDLVRMPKHWATHRSEPKKSDPVPMWNMPADLTYSLVGG